MEMPSVVGYLNMQLDLWCFDMTFYCRVGSRMEEYRKTNQLIKACGHDTRELEGAIAHADKAFELLKAAREKAVAQFKVDGVCFTVDKAKSKELEAARLQ
jgi:hypothetical protein